MRPLVGLASIALLFASAALAQVRETVNVNFVEVPVTVLDRNGDPVRGLTKDRFELIDRGKTRTITSFETIDFASPESLKKTSALNPAVRRNFLLLFDLTFSSPVGRVKAQEAARNFLARGLHRQDLAAIGTIDVEHGLRLLTAFTTDRNLLTAAIANPTNFRSSDPLQIAGQQVFETQTDQATTNLPEADAVAEFQRDVARGEQRLNEQFKRSRAEREIKLLEVLARTVRNVNGRKEVVLFSEGFDPKLIQGRDAHAAADDQREEMDQITSGQYWKVDSDTRYGNSTSLSLLSEMGRAFRGSDIVLHAVDIRGVRVENDLQKGAQLNSNEALFLIANPTGGGVFRNSNDLTADLDRMMREQEVVYILGFQPTITTPGKFHELKVRVKQAPGARLVHRAGYYERGAENSIERALTTAEIIAKKVWHRGAEFTARDLFDFALVARNEPGVLGTIAPILDARRDALMRRLATRDIVLREDFAALDVLNGTVLTDCKPRHRHQEFLAFLRRIENSVPQKLDIHLIVDNYSTHKTPRMRA